MVSAGRGGTPTRHQLALSDLRRLALGAGVALAHTKKTNDKKWKELEVKVSRDAAIIVPRRQRMGAAKIAELDGQIANVEKQRDSATKTAKLKSSETNAH